MLTGLHFLSIYMCNSECARCFVYSGPKAPGTFTSAQIRKLLFATNVSCEELNNVIYSPLPRVPIKSIDG